MEFALTCNPDIVCVGEMKSAEAFAAQEAARTGHAVITTTHANSCKATYYRMVTLCTQKYDMGDKTLYNLVTEAFPIVLFVKSWRTTAAVSWRSPNVRFWRTAPGSSTPFTAIMYRKPLSKMAR